MLGTCAPTAQPTPAPVLATIELRLRLTCLPAGTPADDPLTLAANVNGWDPTAGGFRFARTPGQPPELRLRLPRGTLLHFKITRGSWPRAESAAAGAARPNRTLALTADAAHELCVEAWADLSGGPARPTTRSGDVERLGPLLAPQLDNRRAVLVWLPPGYRGSQQRYPVLYLNDGANVFDAATSFSGLEWQADESAATQARTGRGAILVAVGLPESSGGAQRLSEYGPFPAPRLGASGRAPLYVDFLVRTLKPLVDARYRTRSEAAATGIAGSSMGGLVSLYAAWREPGVFGFAGVLSPSLWFADGRIFSWVSERRPQPAPRVWLDTGTEEGDTLEQAAGQVADVRRMAARLRAQGATVELRVEPGTHSEPAWARRFPALLAWFLAGISPDTPTPALERVPSPAGARPGRVLRGPGCLR